VSTEAWIFVVGFRVFDVGLLIVWMIWFFRLRDDEDDPPEDDDGGGGPEPGSRPEGPGGGGGMPLPDGRFAPGRARLRDSHRSRRRARRRGGDALPQPLPARVRRPRSPVPAHRRP
jgi:hypothetical protein